MMDKIVLFVYLINQVWLFYLVSIYVFVVLVAMNYVIKWKNALFADKAKLIIFISNHRDWITYAG